MEIWCVLCGGYIENVYRCFAMKCYFRSFDVGPGDCNVIRLADGDRQYSIMVDCGSYTKSVKAYVRDVLHNHINLLIATHIDGDHIQGMTRMLNEHKGLTIGEIWYNAYRRDSDFAPVELTEQQQSILQDLQEQLLLEFDAINYREINAKQGRTLAESILTNDSYKHIWKRKPITKDTADYDIPGGWGRIVFLSPQPEAIETIDEKFKETFDETFMREWNDSIAHGEELQELLIRLVEQMANGVDSQEIAASDEPRYDASYVRKQANIETTDSSETNGSSIAFMLECGAHKIAMLGDAFSNTIVSAIDAKYATEDKPLECDAIKVSHHGSNGNNSRLLYEHINSHMFIIPGGKGDKYPTFGTLGRIAETHKDGQIKHIIFSYHSSQAEEMHAMDEEVKKDLGIETVIGEEEYELFEWQND